MTPTKFGGEDLDVLDLRTIDLNLSALSTEPCLAAAPDGGRRLKKEEKQ